MMTKVALYAFSQKWFSCRAMRQALQENLPMTWLAARQMSNRFRSERFNPLMDRLYTKPYISYLKPA